MYKKILLSSLVCSILLFSSVGCAKKTDSEAVKTENTGEVKPTSSNSNTSEGAMTAALGPEVNQNDAKAVLDKLHSEFPQMKVSRMENSPIKGYYQVLTDGEVFYISSDAKMMFIGNIIAIDKPQKVNLTEDVRKTSRKELMSSVPESSMVVFGPKDDKKVEHVITVFTDVDCGYCRKFHSEIQSFVDKGIKVRYMPFPRAGVDSDSYNKAVTVWCAKNTQEAMNKAKLSDNFKADKKLCDKKSVVNESMMLVQKLGLNGTPAMLLEDGTLIPGYMPADRLKAALDEAAKEQLAKKQ